MFVQVTITLSNDESAAALAGNATQLAVAVLDAIGGDETKDVVNVQLNDSGMAGNIAPMMTPEQSVQREEELAQPSELNASE